MYTMQSEILTILNTPVYLILDLSFLHFLFDAYEISESDGKYAGIKKRGVLFKQSEMILL